VLKKSRKGIKMTSKKRKRNKSEILLLVEVVAGIVIGFIGIVCILIGIAGLILPVIPGVLFLALGVFLLRKVWKKKNSENKK